MQSVAIKRSISPFCGIDGILSRFLDLGEKLVKNLVEGAFPKVVRRSPPPQTRATWIPSSLCAHVYQVVVEIGGGVGKSCENQTFLFRLTELVDGGMLRLSQ